MVRDYNTNIHAGPFNRDIIDQIAATYILQSYLDRTQIVNNE